MLLGNLMLVLAVLVVSCEGYRMNRNVMRTSTLLRAEVVSTSRDISWAGDGAVVNDVEEATFADGGLRGIVAKGKVGAAAGLNIGKSEPLVVIPGNLAIETTNTRPPTPFMRFVPQALWENSLWDHRLAYMLLYEKKVLGSKSEKRDWLHKLPESYSTPYYWSKDLVDEQLQYPSLSARIKKQRKDWSELFKRWQQAAAQAQCIDFTASDMTEQEFVWALQTVNSRAFNGAYEGSSADQRQQLLLFTGALTIVWPLAHLGTWEQSLTAAMAVGFSIVVRDVLSSSSLSKSNLKRYVICPYIDMFNHKSSCASDVSYNYFSNRFELRTQGYKAGEQVFISYGRQSNDRLLQYYGFIDEENPFDSYDFGQGILELLLLRGDDLSKTVPFPSFPSFPSSSSSSSSEGTSEEGSGGSKLESTALTPAARLQAISKALRMTEVNDMTYLGARKATQARADELPVRLFRQPPLSLFKSETSDSEEVDEGQRQATLIADGGVVSRFDDVSVRTLRALYCNEQEWAALTSLGGSGSRLGNNNLRNLDGLGQPLSAATELSVESALKSLCRLELEDKATSLQVDAAWLGKGSSSSSSSSSEGAMENAKKGFGDRDSEREKTGGQQKGRGRKGSSSSSKGVQKVEMDPSGSFSDSMRSAVLFRMEKKRLLLAAAEE